jgi:hypothetical protein
MKKLSKNAKIGIGLLLVAILVYFLYKKYKKPIDEGDDEPITEDQLEVKVASKPKPKASDWNTKISYDMQLYKGNKGEMVKLMQQAINRNRNLYKMKNISEDGIFGNITLASVKAITNKSNASYNDIKAVVIANYKKAGKADPYASGSQIAASIFSNVYI